MAGFFFEIMSESIKPSDRFPKYKGSEDQLQKAVARYLDSIGSFWFHCPNGGSRHGLEAAKLKQMGVKALMESNEYWMEEHSVLDKEISQKEAEISRWATALFMVGTYAIAMTVLFFWIVRQ